MIIITITGSFNGFGSQVNTNGIISFQRAYDIPRRFQLFSTIALIAPFWDFVDFRRSENVFFRQTSNATLLQRARDQLQESLPSYSNFTPTILFIATWDRVAQYVPRPIFGGSEELQVSAYMTILLLVTIPTYCNNTALRSGGSDIMGTWSAMEN